MADTHLNMAMNRALLFRSISKGHLFPIVLFGACALFLFLPYLMHPDWLIWPASGLGSDIIIQAWPEANTFTETFKAGQIQLWDSSIALGSPIAGKIGGMWLYLFTFVFLIAPTSFGFTLMACIHIFLAGVLAYFCFLTFFGGTRFGAAVCGVVFMLMPKTLAHLAGGHHNLVYGLTWTPAALMFAYRYLQSEKIRFALLGGLALTLQLPNHPQILLGTIYLLMGMWVWYVAKSRFAHELSISLRQRIWIATKGAFSIGIVTATTGMIWWLPSLELLPWLKLIEFDSFYKFWYQTSPAMLLTLLFPAEFQFPEWTFYFGIGSLSLAILALTGNHRNVARMLWILLLLALMLGLGDQTPIYPSLVKLLPGFTFFRTRTRFWFFGGLAGALLAGLGANALDSSWRSLGSRRKWLILSLIAYSLVGITSLSVIWWLTKKPPSNLLRSVICGILLGCIVVFWENGAPLVNFRSYFVVGVLLLDLIPLAKSYMIPIEPEKTFLKGNNITSFLQKTDDAYRVFSPTKSLSTAITNELGIEAIDGVLNLQLTHSIDLINMASGCRQPGYTNKIPSCILETDQNYDAASLPDATLLGLLNTQYIISDLPLSDPDFIPVFDDEGQQLYINQRFLPRTFFVEEVRLVSNGVAALEMLDQVNIKSTALVPDRYAPIVSEVGTEEVDGSIEKIDRMPGDIRLRVTSDRKALLVYSEAWAPGWRATIDFIQAPVIQVDSALLGVVVPAGTTEVRLYYYPAGWVISKVITPISTLLVVIIIFVSWKREQTLSNTKPFTHNLLEQAKKR